MMTLCLYLVEDPTATGYDVWDKWVVAAASRKQAPNGVKKQLLPT
jgi:hypothetical protein